MGPKSLPGTLLGALLQKVLFFLRFFVPMVAKWEPRGSPKIITLPEHPTCENIFQMFWRMGLGRSLERITKHARMGHLGGSTKWKQVASTYVGKSSKAGSHFPLTHSTFRKPLNNPGPKKIYRPCGSPLVFHKDGTLQTLGSAVKVYVFSDASCNARHSRV